MGTLLAGLGVPSLPGLKALCSFLIGPILHLIFLHTDNQPITVHWTLIIQNINALLVSLVLSQRESSLLQAPDSEQGLDPRCLNFLEKKKLVDFRVCILKKSDLRWASGPGQGLGPQTRVGEQRLLLGPEIETHWWKTGPHCFCSREHFPSIKTRHSCLGFWAH